MQGTGREERMKIEGGCLCGKVRYSGEAEPIFVGVCHCSACQKGSGTAFNTVMAVPKAGISTSGKVQTYQGRGDSGKPTYRRFCPECGSPVAIEAELMPDAVMIPVGTLDDKSGVKPAMQIYCDSAQPWAMLEGGIQRFPKMPAPGG
jgi:hypothetical protein